MPIEPVLVLQVLTGASLFLGHGLPKLKDTARTIAWFRKEGYGLMGALYAMAVEGVASVLLVLGVFPRIMAALVAIDMLGVMVHYWKRKEAFDGGWEPGYLYFMSAIVIVLGGVSAWGWVL